MEMSIEAAFPDRLRPLLERFREGRRGGLARAISVVEDERSGFQALLHALLRDGLQARRVGVTGPPGAGKSSLVTGLAAAYRERNEEVGVVAVDPTSPYSGGALLGDRIRMNDLSTDPGIFIRSMATRGSLGGLATTTREVIDLMDAFGFPRVLVETVGVGQTELEITGATDTVVVVLVPESGDAIQAMKAGLMEIGDVFVVNKADRPGADRLVKEIRQAMHLRAGEAMRGIPAHHGVDPSRAGLRGSSGGGGSDPAGRDGEAAAGPPPVVGPSEGDGDAVARDSQEHESGPWAVPVVTTVAHRGEGLPDLVEALEAHREHLVASGELAARRMERAERRVRDVVDREIRRVAWSSEVVDDALRSGLDGISAGRETPYSVARRIVERVLRVHG